MIKVGDRVKIKGNPDWATMSLDGKIGTVLIVGHFAFGCAVFDEDWSSPWWIPYGDVTLVEA